eukprot:1194495-Prorocentrum_minimum.AAC.1
MLPATYKAALRRERGAAGEAGEAESSGEPPTEGVHTARHSRTRGVAGDGRPAGGPGHTLGVARRGSQGSEGANWRASMHLGPAVREGSRQEESKIQIADPGPLHTQGRVECSGNNTRSHSAWGLGGQCY